MKMVILIERDFNQFFAYVAVHIGFRPELLIESKLTMVLKV